MYEVYVGEAPNFELLYEDTSMAPALAVIDPVLSLEEGKAGSFTCTVPPTHPLWGTLKKRQTEVRVYRRGTLMWYGQIFDEDLDFIKQKKIVAAGPMDYLNNTMQTNREEVPISNQAELTAHLTSIFNVHNEWVDMKVDSNGGVYSDETVKSRRRKVYFGGNNVNPEKCSIRIPISNLQPNKFSTSNDTSTKSALGDITSTFGGYFEQRFNTTDGSGEPMVQLIYQPSYIDIDPNTNLPIEVNNRTTSDQVIIFAQTLINLTQTWSTGDICTVIHAKGADDENGNPIDAGYFKVSDELFDRYGWIEKTVTWSDIDQLSALKTVAQRYCLNLQFTNGATDGSTDIGTFNINITALDAAYLNVDINGFNLSENVRVYSEYHGIDALYPVQKMEIHMDRPEATVISLNTDTSNRDLSTSISNMADKVDKVDDVASIAEEVEDLSNDLSELEKWASEGTPYTKADQYAFYALGTNSKDEWWRISGFAYQNIDGMSGLNKKGEGWWLIASDSIARNTQGIIPPNDISRWYRVFHARPSFWLANPDVYTTSIGG